MASPTTKQADEIIHKLQLKPHPEGGYYRETYRCIEQISSAALNERYGGNPRSISTSIYFLLTAESFSAMHRVQSDEIYHFYCGSPLEMLLLYEDGTHEMLLIGSDPLAGHHPQFTIPRGVWQGSRVVAPGEFSLVGATVAPGFEFQDFELGTRSQLVKQFPAQKLMIETLTRA